MSVKARLTRKPYDADLGEYGKEAEAVVRNWLTVIGYTVSKDESQFGPDIHYCSPDGLEEPFTVEVERCEHRRWENGPFPFTTISVIERRFKYLKTGLNMVVCADMTLAYIVYRSSAIEAFKERGLTSFSNRYVGNETRLLVPKKLCKLFDLTNETPRSIDRYKPGSLFDVR